MAREEHEDKQRGRAAKRQSSSKKPTRKRSKRMRSRHPLRDLVDHRQMRALAKKERVQIFAILCERIASPKEISVELGEGLSQVSYHVNVLRKCRLIVLDHTIPRRGAVEHFFRAASPTLIPPDAWNNLTPAMRKEISVSILQQFFADASASMEAGLFDDSPGELSWTPLILDAAGLKELGRLSRDFLEAVVTLQTNASRRLRQGKGKKATDITSATVFLASFLSARSPKDGKKASARKKR